MLSLRLKTIASLIKKDATVLDIGTDHAYLPIFLQKNNLCKRVIASDVSKNALSNAQRNIDKYHADIKLYLSDGLEEINDDYDTITISGMGTLTIINILKDKDLPNNIIISSNNNLYELRVFMNKIGYKIEDEKTIKDMGKYYDIIAYKKGCEKLSDTVLRFGKSNNKEYYQYLYNKELEIYNNLSLKNKLKKRKNLSILKKLAN